MPLALLIELLGIPQDASEHGFVIDSMLEMLHWFMLILFAGWGTFYFYTLYKFRRSASPTATYSGVKSHLPTKLEGGILVLEVVLLMSFAAPIWAERIVDLPTGPDVIQIRAVGQQYAWNFQYSGADGILGKRHADLVSSSNSLGLDRTEPGAADDLTTLNEVHIPVDHPVVFHVTSKDVIHDFCIPSMRVGQDAIPGSEIAVWFKPIRTGTYDIVCAQLCGANHYAMKGTLVVDTEKDYKAWFEDTAKQTGINAGDGFIHATSSTK